MPFLIYLYMPKIVTHHGGFGNSKARIPDILILKLIHMCFSASASFGAGTVLATINVMTIKKIQEPSQVFFACIPLLFCVQQISEGLLWLSLSNPDFLEFKKPTIYIFLIFAQVIWPIWVPYSILKLEKNSRLYKFQQMLLGIGLLVSLYLGFCLINYPVDAKIIGNHISYKQDYPIIFGGYGDLLYSIATIFPSLISSVKHMWILGITILISYFITLLIYTDYVISVWCFFASVISITVLFIMQEMKIRNEKIAYFNS